MHTGSVSSTTTYTVERDDDLPLRLTGHIIGQAIDDHRDNDTRSEVTLFRTDGRRLLVASTYFDANFLPRPKCRAAMFETAPALITWLRAADTQKLDPTSLRALREAAGADYEVAAAFKEIVD